jgi:DNA-binding IclR family transcriptional regulator
MAALERVGDDVTFSELGAAVGFPRSTVHRIAAALEAEGPVITSSRGLLRLGPRLVSMARASRRHLGDAARPRLAEFSRTVEETVGLSAALLSR